MTMSVSNFNPALSFRYRHPSRTTGMQPQNLPRPTWKGVNGFGCAACDSAGVNGLGNTVKVLFGLKGLGEATEEGSVSPAVYALVTVLSTLGAATGAYHGYKRNNSVGWAVAWFFLGGWFPMITIPVSIAQGYGKRAK